MNFTAASNLFEKKAHILIAISGGPDSVCLLDILAFLQKRCSTTLAIAHVNYQLREEESKADELFVRGLAKQYQLPCFVKRYPKNTKKFDEESLRNFRYHYFTEIATKHGFDTIALGHQKNDQAETFLLNLLRGSGALGLASMLPKHGPYIRPLLDTSRGEILQYLSTRHLKFRLDKSNADVRFTRNRIRKELIPFLQNRFNPNIITTLAHSATLFRDRTRDTGDDASICPVSYQPNKAVLSRRDFRALPMPVQKTLLRNIARTISEKQFTPTQAVLSELRKIIIATKTESTSLSTGPLKCTRNHDRVFLLYLPS